MQPLMSLIVATRGRAAPFNQLFESLDAQIYRAFEVLIVDQNPNDILAPFLAERTWSFPVRHLHTPTQTGASRGRNAGLEHARGTIVLFPDDDCWYPPDFLAQAAERMAILNADILTGRAADATGRDINGRFEATAQRIDRANVWTTGIEWVVFFKSSVLNALGGYDPNIGIGASTPWQSCEAQDIMLRALDRGFACFYDPALYGHHAELDIDDPAMLRKGRAYGRGLGYVLRLHRYPATAAANWIARPAVKALLWLGRGHLGRFRYYSSVALGRSEGWLKRVVG